MEIQLSKVRWHLERKIPLEEEPHEGSSVRRRPPMCRPQTPQGLSQCRLWAPQFLIGRSEAGPTDRHL